MTNSTRRSFLKTASALPLATPAVLTASKPKVMKNIMVHHVYFWLKNSGNEADRAKLVEGLTKLTAVKSIKSWHIGIPAGTSREVIDGSYAISWLTIFKNKEAEAAYQVDPIHLAFVKDYAHLWSKVVVYDSVDLA